MRHPTAALLVLETKYGYMVVRSRPNIGVLYSFSIRVLYTDQGTIVLLTKREPIMLDHASVNQLHGRDRTLRDSEH